MQWNISEEIRLFREEVGAGIEILKDQQADLERRSCENTLARLMTDKFRAQANEFEATQQGNNRVAQQAREAQELYQEEYDREKKMCKF